jgi:hypothetical protein
MTDSPDPRAGADEVWRRDEVESPCIQICMLHPEARICVGCYRTGDEIAAWSSLSPDERRRLMAELPERSTLIPGRRGGRGARRGGGREGDGGA